MNLSETEWQAHVEFFDIFPRGVSDCHLHEVVQVGCSLGQWIVICVGGKKVIVKKIRTIIM